MSSSATVAFGGYARALREQRGLTLRRVCELSANSALEIDKATLSRLERGHQNPGLSTLIQLSRIYDVPVEALADRFELDSELDRLGLVDTYGRSRSELAGLGRRALLQKNDKWSAYGWFRAALDRATLDEIDPRLADADEQKAVARLDLATVARSLGKNRYALFEYREVERSGRLPEAWHPVLLDRIANCHRCQRHFDVAERYADRAVGEALTLNDRRTLAHAYQSLAAIAMDQMAPEQAIEPLRRAFRASRDADVGSCAGALAPNPGFEVDTLVQLADAYCDQGRYRRAANVALAAKRLAIARVLPGARAFSDLFLGSAEEAAGRHNRALHLWRNVVLWARIQNNHRLEFMAEFFIFRQATGRGQRGLAEASRRRLERLTPWVRSGLPQVIEFREMCGGRIDSSVDPTNRCRTDRGKPAGRGRFVTAPGVESTTP